MVTAPVFLKEGRTAVQFGSIEGGVLAQGGEALEGELQAAVDLAERLINVGFHRLALGTGIGDLDI